MRAKRMASKGAAAARSERPALQLPAALKAAAPAGRPDAGERPYARRAWLRAPAPEQGHALPETPGFGGRKLSEESSGWSPGKSSVSSPRKAQDGRGWTERDGAEIEAMIHAAMQQAELLASADAPEAGPEFVEERQDVGMQRLDEHLALGGENFHDANWQGVPAHLRVNAKLTASRGKGAQATRAVEQFMCQRRVFGSVTPWHPQEDFLNLGPLQTRLTRFTLDEAVAAKKERRAFHAHGEAAAKAEGRRSATPARQPRGLSPLPPRAATATPLFRAPTPGLPPYGRATPRPGTSSPALFLDAPRPQVLASAPIPEEGPFERGPRRAAPERKAEADLQHRAKVLAKLRSRGLV